MKKAIDVLRNNVQFVLTEQDIESIVNAMKIYASHVAIEAEKWRMKSEELEKQLLHYAVNVLPDKDAQLERLEILLARVKFDFDNGGHSSKETRDEIENLLSNK